MNKLLILFLFSFSLLSGCQAYNSQTYSTGLQPMNTETGTVISVREVKIAAPKNGIGSMAGALVGAAGASSLAGNSSGLGRMLGTAIGAIAGGAVGQHIQSATIGDGQQVTVELPDHRLLTVVQQGQKLRVGDQVGISFAASGKTRVFILGSN